MTERPNFLDPFEGYETVILESNNPSEGSLDIEKVENAIAPDRKPVVAIPCDALPRLGIPARVILVTRKR